MARNVKTTMPMIPEPAPPAKGAKAGTEIVLDTWLDDRVRALYQSVLDEPLPDDMVSRLRRQTH